MENEVFRFDSEAWCVIFCSPHSGSVRVISNIAEENTALHHAEKMKKEGGHVFKVCKAGVLIAALELIKDKIQTTGLNSDVKADQARALHRVVRAMHDGNCPKCGYLAPSVEFEFPRACDSTFTKKAIDHLCPSCGFHISYEEAMVALAEFQPYMKANVDLFEKWRKERCG